MTFATSTIQSSQSAISNIEKQIAQLQEQLTSLQERQQAIKGAEQQGLSAISQYKQAIATIAQLDEPEMLQQFLEEMAAITSQAIGAPQLPDVDISDEVEPGPVEPDTPLVEDGTPLVEDEVSLVTDETPLVENELVENVPESVENIPEIYAGIKFTALKSYAAKHGIKTHKMNKAKIATALYDAGHGPGKVESWLVNQGNVKV
jgi:uncharacterized phage infection (PIP) family protein YhgE